MDLKVFALAAVLTVAVGCAPSADTMSTESATGSDALAATTEGNVETTTTVSSPEPEPMEQTPKYAPKDGDEVAILTTNHGRIVLMFFPEKAPNHVARFKEAVRKDIYKGTKFHRVIPGFMIQGGDPNSKDDDRSNDGSGGWGTPLKAEFNDIEHIPGILSAARTSDPNSASSQFFLMHARSKHLDGQYSVYGYAVEGIDVINKIVNLPKDPRDNPLPENPAIIEDAKLAKWPVEKS